MAQYRIRGNYGIVDARVERSQRHGTWHPCACNTTRSDPRPGYIVRNRGTQPHMIYTDQENEWLSTPAKNKSKRVSNQTQDGSAPKQAGLAQARLGHDHHHRDRRRVIRDAGAGITWTDIVSAPRGSSCYQHWCLWHTTRSSSPPL
jgi:hypothetical protein